jgi:hypothetical protein
VKPYRLVIPLCAAVLASCTTVQNSVYQSRAPEIRGERAIASSIELVSEVSLKSTVLGVFYSKEVFQSGDAQTILFTRRTGGLISGKAKGAINDYDLGETSSLSVQQATKFLSAIDQFLSTDPKTLDPARMDNFELYSGTLDMSAGNDRYRPFKDVTFIVVCSVTKAKKSFKTVFPGFVTDMYGRRTSTYATFDLTEDQVKKLREAIAAALQKAEPDVRSAEGSSPA